MRTKTIDPQALRWRAGILGLALVTIALLALPVSAQSADPPQLWQKCPTGSGAAECQHPGSIAADAATGHIFIADQANHRINELTAWGEFVRTWGWGVVSSGPGDNPQNEIQAVSVDASAGSFALRYFSSFSGGADSEVTPQLAFDSTSSSFSNALEALDSLDTGDIAVSGPAGGPWSIEFTGKRADVDIPQVKVVDSTLTGPGTSAVVTTEDGANFEVCVPADGDSCRAAQTGATGFGAFFPSAPSKARPGQFDSPRGVAVDSAGDVYVVDRGNNRVQKFDSEGNFLLMFGGGVNQGPSNPGDLCTAAHLVDGDTCGAGTQGTGNGQFDELSSLAVTPDDRVWVGDVNRIQEFDTGGFYQGEIALPEAGTVGSLAADPQSGDLYFDYATKLAPYPSAEAIQPDVHRLDPNTGDEVGEPLEVDFPGVLAADESGNVYVYGQTLFVSSGDLRNHPSRILQFDSAGNLTDVYLKGAFESGTSNNPAGASGIAASSACGIAGADLYVTTANASNGSIRAYGSAPTDLELCPPPPVPPTISNQFATEIGTETATLKAKINPHFWSDTTYYIEYGAAACASSPCAKEPAEAAKLTDQVLDADLPVAVELKGLDPGAIYHYRFVAQSSGGGPAFGPDRTFGTFPEPTAPEACPNDEFRTETPSAILPDCRAYEMVTPIQKNGGDVSQGPNSTNLGQRDKLDQATPDGGALTYSSYRSFAGSESGGWTTQYLARRDPSSGWQTEPLSPPESGPSFYLGASQAHHFQAFSSDLCTAFYLNHTDNSISPGDIVGFPDLHRRHNCDDPGFETLTTVAPPTLPPGQFSQAGGGAHSYWLQTQGFSADGSSVVFRANDKLTSNASAATDDGGSPIFQLYVKTPSAFRLVSILPSPGGSTPGGAAATHSSVGTHFFADDVGFQNDSVYRAVSEDGSHVFWTATNTEANGGGVGTGDGPGTIYLRVNPDRAQSPISEGKCTDPARACTIAVSESVGPGSSHFHAAAPDGSKALFTIDVGGKLEDLYSFDVATETPTLIAHDVIGLLGASDDLTRVYFASSAVLAPGATAGETNLYLHQEGSGKTFIGGLAEGTAYPSGFPSRAPLSFNPSFHTSRVTADGAVALFATAAPMTGYDNTDAVSGERDTEVFRYDALADELRCVSCNPSGARPSGRKTDGSAGIWAAALIPAWEYSHHPSRVLSEDGSRAFFNSVDALDPRDVNGKQDVYQWQEPGTGDCEEGGPGFVASADGCLSLITPGTSPSDSEVVDASADGSNVFIRTRSRLHGSDTDDLFDIYDARSLGGFPAPPTSPLPCEGDSCQGAATPTPTASGPGSSVFSGPGNRGRQGTPPAKCPKGKRKVRRSGKVRCVKRPARKRENGKRAAGHNRSAAR